MELCLVCPCLHRRQKLRWKTSPGLPYYSRSHSKRFVNSCPFLKVGQLVDCQQEVIQVIVLIKLNLQLRIVAVDDHCCSTSRSNIKNGGESLDKVFLLFILWRVDTPRGVHHEHNIQKLVTLWVGLARSRTDGRRC